MAAAGHFIDEVDDFDRWFAKKLPGKDSIPEAEESACMLAACFFSPSIVIELQPLLRFKEVSLGPERAWNPQII